MKPNIKESLDKLKETSYGVALSEYLNEQLAGLRDFSTITGTVEEKGRMVEGRQEAEKIIVRMFKFLDFKPDKTKLKNQYL